MKCLFWSDIAFTMASTFGFQTSPWFSMMSDLTFMTQKGTAAFDSIGKT